MRAGLTRQGLRRHPWSFAGPFITQCIAATLISGALGFDASLRAARLGGAARRALDASDIKDAGVLFLILAIYLTAIIVGVTMTSSIGRQARDMALVRAIGATPGQVRRAIAAQAAVVAVPAALLGVPLGSLAGRAWTEGLVAHGVVPAGVRFHFSVLALPAALAATVVTSLIGAMIAALRPARVRPSVALTEAAVPRRWGGVIRTVAGLVLVGTGVAKLVNVINGDPRTAIGDSLPVLLLLCVGAGCLSPVLLRAVGRLPRLAGGTGAIAADSIAVRAQALSGAMIPLLLAGAFTLMKVVEHATSEHVHGVPDSATSVWVDVTGTGVYVAFAAVAGVNALVTVLLARRRELAVLRLAGATRARTLAVLIWEAGVVTVTGLMVAAAVAGAVLPPIVHAESGTWMPYPPAGQLAAVALVAAALVGLGTAVPAAVVLRRSPVESVAVAL